MRRKYTGKVIGIIGRIPYKFKKAGVNKKYLTPAFPCIMINKVRREGRFFWHAGMERVMEKIVEQGILYDFYGPLLTAHQQEIYEAVVYNNLSLGEIAKENGISRQGVHDIIKRCDKILAEYEEKLQLVKRFASSRKKLERIKVLAEEIKENGMEHQAREISSLTAEIIEEL